MVAAHQIARIREVFGREPFLLEWVLRDPVARTSGLIANLTEFQREFLYQYCVLGLDEAKLMEWLAQTSPDLEFSVALQEVTTAIVESAPALLDMHRERKRLQGNRRKA